MMTKINFNVIYFLKQIKMQTLSGNKDTDLQILQNLNDTDFPTICKVNKYIHSLCENESFWLNRFLLKTKYTRMDLDNMRKPIKPNDGPLTYKKLYEYLQLNNTDKVKWIIIKRDNVYLYKAHNRKWNWLANPEFLSKYNSKNI